MANTGIQVAKRTLELLFPQLHIEIPYYPTGRILIRVGLLQSHSYPMYLEEPMQGLLPTIFLLQ